MAEVIPLATWNGFHRIWTHTPKGTRKGRGGTGAATSTDLKKEAHKGESEHDVGPDVFKLVGAKLDGGLDQLDDALAKQHRPAPKGSYAHSIEAIGWGV